MKISKIITLTLFISIGLVNIGYASNLSDKTNPDYVNEIASSNWSMVYNGLAHSPMADDLYVEVFCRQEFGRDAYMAKIYTTRNGEYILVNETRNVRYESGQYSFNYNGHTYYTRS